jgi:hypothetical protein
LYYKQEEIIHSSLQGDSTCSFENQDEGHLGAHFEDDQPTHLSSTTLLFYQLVPLQTDILHGLATQDKVSAINRALSHL